MNEEMSAKTSSGDSIFKKILRGIALAGFGIIGTLFVIAEGIFGVHKVPKKKSKA